MKCLFVCSEQFCKCSRCGRSVQVSLMPIRATCRAAGLGDMVASGLSTVGITKERVSKLVGRDCGCQKRQEALNALGRRLGIGR
jgi:hypothetical protein